MVRRRLTCPSLKTLFVLGALLSGFLSAVGRSQELGPVGGISGKDDFRHYCAQCHGLSGTGNGPVAPALKKKPTDLTQLAKKNGGIFPEQEVRDFIDGTKTTPSHGTREMPIWGYQFSAPARTGSGSSFSNVNVQRKIDLLVAYVKSIQQK